jgi:nucleotide exchange factor SIL1
VDFNQELMEKTRMFSDFELMKIAITDLNNVSTSLEDRYRALLELLELVEPLNNANGTNISINVYSLR